MDIQYLRCTRYIKDVDVPPSLHASSTYLLAYGSHVARLRRRRHRAHAPAVHAASHVDHEKIDAWFLLFLCMHVVPFPMLMVLRLMALRAAGAPL